MPPPGTKLCCCRAVGCFRNDEVNTATGRTVKGQYLPATTWRRHRDAQKDEDLQDQTEEFASVTLLRTVAPTNDSARAITKPSVVDSLSRLSSTSKEPLPDVHISSDSPSIEPDMISRSASNLRHYGNLLDQRIGAFTPPRALRFASLPTPLVPYQSQLTTEPPTNSGIYSLITRDANNDALMRFEQWLVITLKALSGVDCYQDEYLLSKRGEMVEKVHEALKRVDNVKRFEWDRQRAMGETCENQDRQAPLRVDTSAFLSRNRSLNDMESIPLVCVFIVTVLNVLCRVSRNKCNFVLIALRYMVNQALGFSPMESKWHRKKILSSIPRDVRTAKERFEVEPSLITYVCCPKCRALYAPDAVGQLEGYPDTCEDQELPGGPMCGTPLRRTRYINGESYSVPIRTYLYQDFPSWLARLISRPEIEAILDKPLKSVNSPPKDIYTDVWDGPIIRNFIGPDGQPFFQYTGPEARLLFGFGYDGFNPFHNKTAGKGASVGAMFLFCYNLPEEIRLKHENMFLAGVVNGPKAPSLTQSNHYVRPLVNQFETFWSRGYHFTKTPGRAEGLVAKGAIVPLIMDLHALRQITATGAFNAKFFCTFCMLLLRDIDNVDPKTWPPIRTCAEHRQHAEEWLNATTAKAREDLFKEHSLRWTEFQRFSYWVPSTSMVVDPMHAWMNLIRNLICDTWGIDHRLASGDGIFVGRLPKSKWPVTSKELISALQAFKNDEETILRKVRKAVLYQLCEVRELRHADTCHQMIVTLKQHFKENPSHLENDMAAAQMRSDPAPVENSKEAFSFTATSNRLLGLTTESRAVDEPWLTGRLKGNLQRLCQNRGVTYGEKETRESIVQKLVIDQLANQGKQVPSADLTQGKAVLGADMVAELDLDICRTVLPSWMSPGPKHFDASEHGKLSADEWRTTALLRLAITLPRVWGPQGGQRRLMLENFMHLTNAMTIPSTRAVIIHPSSKNGARKPTADLFREEYQAYLQGRVELYPTGKIQPTEHIVYHIGDKLGQFGPTHNTCVNAMEWYQGMMQDEPTNMRSGEIEKTFMQGFCMGANLKATVGDSKAPEALRELREPFEAAFRSEGGAMIRDVLSFEGNKFNSPSKEDLEQAHQASLTVDVALLLIQTLNAEYCSAEGFHEYIPSDQRRKGCLPLDPLGWSLSQCQFRGIWYRRARPSNSPAQPGRAFLPHRDSHLLIKSGGISRPIPCSIHTIFAHRHRVPGTAEPIIEIYFLVREYLELTPEHAALDHWRNFPVSGGRLYYDKLQKNPRIVNVKNVVGHFAKTPYQAGEITGIDHPCIHVLPLVWHNMFEWLEYLGGVD